MMDQGQGIASCCLEGVLGHQLLCHRLEGKRRERGGSQLYRAKGAYKGFRHGMVLSPCVWDERRDWLLHSVTLPHMRNQFRGYPVCVLLVAPQFCLKSLVFPLGSEYQGT